MDENTDAVLAGVCVVLIVGVEVRDAVRDAVKDAD